MAAIDIGPRPSPTGGGVPRKTTVVTCIRVRKSFVAAYNTNIDSDSESKYGTLESACHNLEKGERMGIPYLEYQQAENVGSPTDVKW